MCHFIFSVNERMAVIKQSIIVMDLSVEKQFRFIDNRYTGKTTSYFPVG